MLKKTITYTDHNDVEHTRDFWFHLNKTDLLELEVSTGVGLEEWVKQVMASRDGAAVVEMLRNIIGRAVGERTPTGEFVKSQAFREYFLASEAYGEILLELFRKPENGSEFIKSLLSKKNQAALEANQPSAAPVFQKPAEDKKELSEYTEQELLALSDDEWTALVGKDARKWPKALLPIAMRRRIAKKEASVPWPGYTYDELMNMSSSELNETATRWPNEVSNVIAAHDAQ